MSYKQNLQQSVVVSFMPSYHLQLCEQNHLASACAYFQVLNLRS